MSRKRGDAWQRGGKVEGMERLDKLLAGTGRWSRREVKALVKSGRVLVAGKLPTGPEEKFLEESVITVDGQRVFCKRYVYLMLHKPGGLVSSTEDPWEPTVLGLLPPALRKLGLFPVGRLDKDTEGLLLMTNDGQTAHRLLSPGRHVDKVYYVETAGELTEQDREAFQAGMILGDGTRCLPAGLEVLAPFNRGLVTLGEGKYHQVKRMLAARGKPVRYLKRISMGPLHLDPALPAGAWRLLTPEEEAQILE